MYSVKQDFFFFFLCPPPRTLKRLWMGRNTQVAFRMLDTLDQMVITWLLALQLVSKLSLKVLCVFLCTYFILYDVWKKNHTSWIYKTRTNIGTLLERNDSVRLNGTIRGIKHGQLPSWSKWFAVRYRLTVLILLHTRRGSDDVNGRWMVAARLRTAANGNWQSRKGRRLKWSIC